MSELVWAYGPTESDPEPGKMWHSGCGGEVLYLGGYICMLCEESEDEPEIAPL